EHLRRRSESIVGGKRPGRGLIDPSRATTLMNGAGVPPGCACRLHLQPPIDLSPNTREFTHRERTRFRSSYPCSAHASGSSRKRAAWNYAKPPDGGNVTAAQGSFPHTRTGQC